MHTDNATQSLPPTCPNHCCWWVRKKQYIMRTPHSRSMNCFHGSTPQVQQALLRHQSTIQTIGALCVIRAHRWTSIDSCLRRWVLNFMNLIFQAFGCQYAEAGTTDDHKSNFIMFTTIADNFLRKSHWIIITTTIFIHPVCIGTRLARFEKK